MYEGIAAYVNAQDSSSVTSHESDNKGYVSFDSVRTVSLRGYTTPMARTSVIQGRDVKPMGYCVA